MAFVSIMLSIFFGETVLKELTESNVLTPQLSVGLFYLCIWSVGYWSCKFRYFWKLKYFNNNKTNKEKLIHEAEV